MTLAAYADAEAHTDLRITFACAAHAFVAWVTLPAWLSHVQLNDIRLLWTRDMWGPYHCLSQLSCEVTDCGVRQPYQLQRAFVHPSLAAMPDAVLPMEFTRDRQMVRVSYDSPLDAAKMLGTRVLVTGSGKHPYTNRHYSGPLHIHCDGSNVPICANCGRLGHSWAHCSSLPRISIRHCGPCAHAGLEDHGEEEPCPVQDAFNANTIEIVRAAIFRAERDGIFAPAHRSLLSSLFSPLHQ